MTNEPSLTQFITAIALLTLPFIVTALVLFYLIIKEGRKKEKPREYSAEVNRLLDIN